MGSRRPATLIVVLGLMPALAHALSLGEATIRSFLMEPLVVEIPVRTRVPSEVEGLRLRLAPQADFERFGIERQSLHEELRFELERRGDAWVLLVRSRAPVREPFISFPVQGIWPEGQLVREYTLFLDPRPLRRPATGSRRPAMPVAVPAPTAARTPAPVASPSPEVYGPVRPGETLWPIAQRLRPTGVSTEQMMMALLRANPDAFVGGNVNNLRAGSVLRLPSPDELGVLSATAARQAFAEQTNVWREETAEPPAAAPIAVTPAGVPAPIGERLAGAPQGPKGEEEPELRILQQAESQAPPPEPTQEVMTAEDDIERKLLLTLETAEAARLEFKSLDAQVAQLQAQMEDMRRLLQLKDRQIAALQEMQAQAPESRPTSQVPGTARVDLQGPGTATARPSAVSVPAALTPDVSSPRAVLQNWWLGIAVAIAGLLILALVAVWSKSRRAGAAPVLAEGGGRSTPQDRPYARQVAALGAGAGAAAGAAAAATPRTRPDETQRLFDGLERKSMPPARPTGSESTRKLGPGALDDEDLQLGDFDLDLVGGQKVSDDEIESWVKDLASDKDADEDEGPTMEDLLADLEPEAGPQRGDDLEVDLRLDRLDELAGTGEAPFSPEARDAGGSATGASEQAAADDFDPDAVELRLELARAYLDIGEIDGAREILEQVVDTAMSGAQREEALALLKNLR